jgi:hypothetical protein
VGVMVQFTKLKHMRDVCSEKSASALMKGSLI